MSNHPMTEECERIAAEQNGTIDDYSAACLREFARFGAADRALHEAADAWLRKAAASCDWGHVNTLCQLNQRLEELIEGLKGGQSDKT